MNEGARLLANGAARGGIELTVGRDVFRTELTRDSNTGVVEVNAGRRVSPLKTGRWVALAFPPMRGVSVGESSGPTPGGPPRPLVEDVLPILLGQTDGRLSSLKQWIVNLDVQSRPGNGISPAQAKANATLLNRFFDVLNAFLPGLNIKFANVDRQTWKVSVVTHGATVTIDQVSQGTSSILGWVGTLMQRMCEIHSGDPNFKQKAAVVLLDEIDAHLHPEWQQQIVATLSQEFPNVQFIATTHSPLIVMELNREQVYRVYWSEDENPCRPSGRVAARARRLWHADQRCVQLAQNSRSGDRKAA